MASPDWKPQVYLIGAGPGDPDLLTRRGEKILRRADVVLYDSLVDPALLELAPPRAELIPVGKRAGGVGPRQSWINGKMIEEARRGRVVVRLKGGDPFIFGRGGEEVLALLDGGIRFEVVPGVTSASSVPAFAGIPVSHRDYSSVVHIVTGHEDPGDAEGHVRWDLFTRPGHTVVVLMGSARLVEILERLSDAGMAPETPLAVIHGGSTPRQQTLRTTVADALASPDRVRLPSPALAVIGAVAGLPEALNWFERRPLFGRRYVLMRPEGIGEEYADALREAGAEIALIHVISLDDQTADPPALLLERLEAARSSQGWLVLPSPNAVDRFFRQLSAVGADARALAGIRVAVVGAKSAHRLSDYGIRADHLSGGGTAGALGEELELEDPASGPLARPAVLIAGARESRPELPLSLAKRNFDIIHHVLYVTIPDLEGLAALHKLDLNSVAGIVAFSPSAVKAVLNNGETRDPLLREAAWFAIGPTTAQMLRRYDIEPAGVAARPSPEALLDVLIAANLSDAGQAVKSTE